MKVKATKAAKAFSEVERQHPYSNWALKGQLMSAFAIINKEIPRSCRSL